MITLQEVERIHEILIDKFGGKKGLRDKGLLESSIQRPFQTFDQKELYPEPVDKAAAILESIISNRPFLDGNKRTAYVVARLVLRANNLDIKATQDEKYEFVISAARGEIRFDQIKEWLANHTESGNESQHSL
jgi:death-on-curing protein